MDGPKLGRGRGHPATKKRKLNEDPGIPASIAETDLKGTNFFACKIPDEHINVSSKPRPANCFEQSGIDDRPSPPEQSDSTSTTNRKQSCENSKQSSINRKNDGPYSATSIYKSSCRFEEAAESRSSSQTPTTGAGICTYDESLSIRYHAREIGLETFFEEAVTRRNIPLQKLCAIFGVCSPTRTVLPSDGPDRGLLVKLKKAIASDMGNRIKLTKYNSVEDAISLVRRAKKIVVITGAGISTSLNIPDFRSQDGLYPKLREMGFHDLKVYLVETLSSKTRSHSFRLHQ